MNKLRADWSKEMLAIIRCRIFWIPIFYPKNIKIKLHSLTHSLAQSLTPRSRVFLEKLTVPQQVKKFPAFYGVRRFITALTSTPTCPYPEPVQSSPCSPIPLPEKPKIL